MPTRPRPKVNDTDNGLGSRAASLMKVEPKELSFKENVDGMRTPGKAKQAAAPTGSRGGKRAAIVKVEDISDIMRRVSLNEKISGTVTVEYSIKTPARAANMGQANEIQIKKETVDITHTSPFPSTLPENTRPAARRTPLFLSADSESEVDWRPATTSKRRGVPTRRIRDPDSESDAELEVSAGPSSGLSSLFRRDSATRAETPESPPERAVRSGPIRSVGKGISHYFDLEARNASRDSEDEEGDASEKNRAWREKYYDDSLGSLRDFIVDDDYVSEEGSSHSEASEGSSDEDYGKPRKASGRRSANKPPAKTASTLGRPSAQPPRSTANRGSTSQCPVGPARPRQANDRTDIIELLDSDSDVVRSDPTNVLDHVSDDESGSDCGVLHYSPPPSRLLTLPDLSTLQIHDSDLEPETPPTPARTSVARRLVPPTPKTPASKKMWATDRTRIAQGIFDELDKKVFDSKLGPKGAGTVLEWNNRLLTTAGQAHSKRTKRPDGSKSEEVKIILSDKVLTGEEQILSTVAHEMCHVASWVISDERKNPHGKVFKTWGRLVMKARPDIEVTTKHDYQIEYKFQWRCLGSACGKIYKRHSKSIDPEKQACGRCRGKLEPLFETKKETLFQVYLRQNIGLAKSAMPGSSHGDVMRALSRQWTAEGPDADHQSHWKALAAAAKQ